MNLSILLVLLLGAGPGQSSGGEAIVAVASNFTAVAEELAEKFAATTGQRLVLMEDGRIRPAGLSMKCSPQVV